LIALSEIVFNSKAFQVIGENLLTALIMSLGASVGIIGLSCLAAWYYKKTKTVQKRRWIVFGVLALATLVFIVLAVMRSTFLALHNITVSPVIFVVVNLFLFIVSCLLSYLIIPRADEQQQRKRRAQLEKAIDSRIQIMESLRVEKNKLSDIVAVRLQYHNHVSDLSKHYKQWCTDLSADLLAIFKRTNLVFRSDRCTPDCFIPVISDNNSDFNNATLL
jgi:hypothetical protein